MDLAQLYVETGLTKSKSEARRAVAQGSVKVNDVRVDDPHAQLFYVDNVWVLLEFGSDPDKRKITRWMAETSETERQLCGKA